jgi:hypothetical protein
MIGNGHAMGVTAEVAQHLHGSAEGDLTDLLYQVEC